MLCGNSVQVQGEQLGSFCLWAVWIRQRAMGYKTTWKIPVKYQNRLSGGNCGVSIMRGFQESFSNCMSCLMGQRGLVKNLVLSCSVSGWYKSASLTLGSGFWGEGEGFPFQRMGAFKITIKPVLEFTLSSLGLKGKAVCLPLMWIIDIIFNCF